MHLKIKNGIPEAYSIEQLRRDNPSTSFPEAPGDSLLAKYDVYPFYQADYPVTDWMTVRVVPGDFEKDKAGKWFQPYTTEQLPLEDASRNVRGQRDAFLQQTDWMALSDNIMSDGMKAYRQALRDITSQVGFPYNVNWPVKP